MSDTKVLKKQAVKEWLKCKENDKYFIYNYCFTMDTRKEENNIFIMRPWPHLCELIDELNKGKSIIIEKSRDMGISWTIMAWQLHKVLFREGFMALNISRKESEVEDPGKTPRSLFGRLDFMYKRLPSFLKLRIDNPFLSFKVASNNSYISGESANPNAGRDTQYSMIFVDETGMIPIFEEMWQSIANSSNFIVLNSTPPREGRNHKFVQLRFTQNSGFKILTYHWSRHPDKNAEWFAKKTLAMTDEDIARELEINYEKAASFKIYHEFDDEYHVAEFQIPYNPRKPLYLSFDFGLDDPESVLFYQKELLADGKKYRLHVINEYEAGNLLTQEHYYNIQKKLIEIGYRGRINDLICYGDPAGKQRERTSKRSVLMEYEALDFRITVKDANLEERRRAVKLLLKSKDDGGNPRILISPNCVNLIDSLKNHQRVKADSDLPRKDKTCHSVTSLEFFCVNEFPPLSPVAVIYGKDPENKIHLETKRELLSMRNLGRFSTERKSLIWTR